VRQTVTNPAFQPADGGLAPAPAPLEEVRIGHNAGRTEVSARTRS
jgi:hypothetical protein